MADIFTFKDLYIGTVMKLDKENRKIGVYIPKLMSAMYSGDVSEYSVPTNNGLQDISFSTNINKSVKKINYFWVRPWYKNKGLPEIGSKVAIWFIDGNITLGFCKEFDPNGDYSVIPEESHENILSLNINNNKENIFTNSNINIDLPNYFNIITKIDDDKNVTFSLQENYNFYEGNSLIDAINNLQKSVKYLTDKTVETFNTTLTSLNSIITSSDELSIKLKTLFSQNKSRVLTLLSSQNNLLDSDAYYSYGFKLLTLLNDTYTSYTNYTTKYNELDENNKSKLSLSTELFNNNIEYIYSYFLNSKINEIDNDIKIVENYFPNTITLNFEYFISNQNLIQKKNTSLTNLELFSIFNNENIPSDMIYNGNTNSAIKFIGWKDNIDNYILNDSLLYRNTALTPAYFGLDYDNSFLNIILVNDFNYNDIQFYLTKNEDQRISSSLSDINTEFHTYLQNTDNYSLLEFNIVYNEISLTLKIK